MPKPSLITVPRNRGSMCRFLGKKLRPSEPPPEYTLVSDRRKKQTKLPGVLPETQPLFRRGWKYDLPDEEAQAKLLRQQRPELFEFTEEDQRKLDENREGK